MAIFSNCFTDEFSLSDVHELDELAHRYRVADRYLTLGPAEIYLNRVLSLTTQGNPLNR